MVYFITVLLAYCSIVYELVMAQSLSAFLGDTVLRYSTTIGLYLASMGVGAFMVRGSIARNPLYPLAKIEILLSIVGGFSVVYLFLFNIFIPSALVTFVLSHSLIIAIGVLTGFEIPLLIEIRRQEKEGTLNYVLGANYFGALCGTLIFPIVLLPTIGVLVTAFSTGLLNAAAALFLLLSKGTGHRRAFPVFVGTSVVAVILFLGVMLSGPIEQYLIGRYISL